MSFLMSLVSMRSISGSRAVALRPSRLSSLENRTFSNFIARKMKNARRERFRKKLAGLGEPASDFFGLFVYTLELFQLPAIPVARLVIFAVLGMGAKVTDEAGDREDHEVEYNEDPTRHRHADSDLVRIKVGSERKPTDKGCGQISYGGIEKEWRRFNHARSVTMSSGFICIWQPGER